jgi:hypothetical protein
MPSLACCYTDEETPFCSNRRFETLPMCKKHNHEVMRTAVFDRLMPWDVMQDLVRLTSQMIEMTSVAERFDMRQEAAARQEERALAVAANRRKLGVVYYLRLSGDRIKIGRTINLQQRMSAMRIPRQDVLAAEPGGAGVESDRHAEFANIRHGRLEDFDATAELMEHIQSIRDQWGDPWELDS